MYSFRPMLILAGSLALTASAWAGFTSPQLVLLDGTGILIDGARTLTLNAGDLDFPNAVQGGTTLHLVVSQGTSFVRYSLSGTAVTGTSATLADHQVDDIEVNTLLSQGVAAPIGVRIVSLTASSLTVTLPAGFTSGSTYAELLAVITEGPVVSNVIPVTLP